MSDADLTYVEGYLHRLTGAIEQLDKDAVACFISLLRQRRRRDGTIYIIGNGGSAGTASHFAVDLGKGASLASDKRFRVHSLTDNVCWITALANDLSYADVFVEQLRNHLREEDLLVAISASGNSENILRAVALANEIGCMTVGLTGGNGGRLANLVDVEIRVPAEHMGCIEDLHLIVAHIVSYSFMDRPEAADEW
ncbi:MAG TPA: SIS domain-containing protein [Firmicutes bacterium]|nr:SIS domain-containing protein [Bacillota bacterium]